MSASLSRSAATAGLGVFVGLLTSLSLPASSPPDVLNPYCSILQVWGDQVSARAQAPIIRSSSHLVRYRSRDDRPNALLILDIVEKGSLVFAVGVVAKELLIFSD